MKPVNQYKKGYPGSRRHNGYFCVCDSDVMKNLFYFDGRPTNLPAHSQYECLYRRCRCGSIEVYHASLEKYGRLLWICGLCHDEIKHYNYKNKK